MSPALAEVVSHLLAQLSFYHKLRKIFKCLVQQCSCKKQPKKSFCFEGVTCTTISVFFFTEVREKKWSRCTSVNPATSRCITEPVMQSRFVQERGYVNSASSAMQQQANEIKIACSLAANHVEAICFDTIPTSPNEGLTPLR